MKRKIISILLALTFVIGSGAVAFADGQIDYSQWDSQAAYPSDVVNTPLFAAVKFLTDRKIVNGYDDGLFHADRTITRAEYTKMMVVATNNQNGMEQHPDSGFSDINKAPWAKEYINTAVSLKLINGMGDGTFAPQGDVTYAQVIAILVRSKGVTDSEMSAYGQWPDNYAKYAQMYNMTGDITISDWNAPATRGDVAKIMYRNLPK